MSYHGFEIFFLALGNADSIFVRHFDNGNQTNILVDGGRKAHTECVRGFLRTLGETRIHHLVCSHHHEDHAGGLIGLVEDTSLSIDHAWVHTGEIASDVANLSIFAAKGYNKLVDTLRASKETQTDLLKALKTRGIEPKSPYTGTEIGPWIVLSPSQAFYQQQLQRIKDERLASALNDRYLNRQLRSVFGEGLGQPLAKAAEEKQEAEGALGAEPTSPENEVSTVLAMEWTEGTKKQWHLLTADAGTEALTEVKLLSEKPLGDRLKHLDFMQIPHHGSRRNVNEDLLDYFKPATAFVSAKGSIKHPSKKVVNAIKDRGGKVYSTHYPDQKEADGHWLRRKRGTVPDLNVTPATPMYDAAK